MASILSIIMHQYAAFGGSVMNGRVVVEVFDLLIPTSRPTSPPSVCPPETPTVNPTANCQTYSTSDFDFARWLSPRNRLQFAMHVLKVKLLHVQIHLTASIVMHVSTTWQVYTREALRYSLNVTRALFITTRVRHEPLVASRLIMVSLAVDSIA